MELVILSFLVHLAAVMLLARTSFSLDLISEEWPEEELAPSDMVAQRGLTISVASNHFDFHMNLYQFSKYYAVTQYHDAMGAFMAAQYPFEQTEQELIFCNTRWHQDA